MKPKETIWMPENNLFPPPHHRHCFGSRTIYQYLVFLYPDVKCILAASEEYGKVRKPAINRLQSSKVALPYHVLTVGLNLLVLLLAVIGVVWLRSYYTGVLQTLIPQLEQVSSACILTGSILFIVVSALKSS